MPNKCIQCEFTRRCALGESPDASVRLLTYNKNTMVCKVRDGIFENIKQLSKETTFSTFAESVIKTCKRVNFKNHLDLSYNQNITFSSDYGGEDGDSIFNTYTFTFQTFSTLQCWHNAIKELKRDRGYSGEASYKDITPKSRGGKLRDWLDITKTNFTGFIVCFAVPIEIDSLFAPTQEILHEKILANENFKDCPFKPKILEKSLRITVFASLLLAMILEDNYGYFWMTDKDSIVQDQQKAEFSSKFLAHNLSLYHPTLKLKKAEYAKPFREDQESDNFSKDFLSLSDLISGAICDYCNVTNVESNPQEIYKMLKPKSIEIIKSTSDIPTYIYLLDKNQKGCQCKGLVLGINE